MSKKGYNWGIERQTITDDATGVEVTQITSYKGNHHHLYFTNPGWYDGGNKLLLGGDRNNATNLFSIDLPSGEITQLTDLADIPGKETEFLHACLNPVLNEACYWYDDKLWAVSLDTLEERLLWTLPKAQTKGMVNVTSDGRYILFCIQEDLSSKVRTDLLRGYVGFEETWRLKPFCQIVRVPTDGSGQADVIHSGNVWMGHLNTSSTQPTHLTFCHEGPWDKVDHRIWAMDMATAKIRPLRERRDRAETIGHEYWFADGERVGYHGFFDGKSFLGSVKFDGSDVLEADFPHHTTHVHSNDHTLVVGDGTSQGGLHESGNVLLWRWNGSRYEPPRVLCNHRCSMHIQANHVHPRISPNNDYVLYTSDRTGYGSPYIAKLPDDIKSLPFVEES